jgi:N-acyl-D-aspartate/D-glutamate deacylase
MRPALLVLTALLGPVPGSSAQEPSRYDVVIRGGRALDGTGNPFFHADVAIDDGHIVLIGKVSDGRADRTIDARGLYVAPGFIDMHSHAMNAFLINGKLAVDASELTGALAGEVLTPRTSARPTSH